MNGKKAKLLRRLAGVTSKTQKSRSYSGVERTARVRTHKEVNLTTGKEEVVSKITTHTYQLNPSTRKLYKAMKKSATKRFGGMVAGAFYKNNAVQYDL
jgi:hypothetical protein